MCGDAFLPIQRSFARAACRTNYFAPAGQETRHPNGPPRPSECAFGLLGFEPDDAGEASQLGHSAEDRRWHERERWAGGGGHSETLQQTKWGPLAFGL